MNIVKNKLVISLTASVLILMGFCIGWLTFRHASIARVQVRENNKDFQFINPLLFTDSGTETIEYQSLKNKINAVIKMTVADSSATKVSVYFRDLNSGRWMGINQADQYTPASMLKVAILIAYLRKAEVNSAILKEKIRIDPKSFNLNSVQTYVPKDPIVGGKTYTINDLLLRMTIDSDNNAAAVLTEAIGTSSINQLYKDLQLPVDTSGAVTYISPELYSRFFRVLYNSTYVSHTLSEKVLEVLGQTNFTSGLIAGVPTGIQVAHKFGERTVTDQAGQPIERELHDCGIVYYPEHPYFLCVMTQGKDFPALEKVISSISSIVWSDVSSFNN